MSFTEIPRNTNPQECPASTVLLADFVVTLAAGGVVEE